MKKQKNSEFVRAFYLRMNSQSGQGLMEYLILVMVIGLFTLAVAKGFGGILKRKFEIARDKVEREVVLGDR